MPTADGDAAEAAEGAGGQRQVLVQASAPSVSSRTGRQSPRTEAAVRLVVQEQRSKQRAAAVPPVAGHSLAEPPSVGATAAEAAMAAVAAAEARAEAGQHKARRTPAAVRLARRKQRR